MQQYLIHIEKIATGTTKKTHHIMFLPLCNVIEFFW
jgi:hypothetical protein